jgi:hypothetical protein
MVMVMTRPLEMPSEVAKAFVQDMRAYFEEENPIKRDEIAILQMHSLQKYWPGKLQLGDVKALFEQMHDRLDD